VSAVSKNERISIFILLYIFFFKIMQASQETLTIVIEHTPFIPII
jgi:hypothetical protein